MVLPLQCAQRLLLVSEQPQPSPVEALTHRADHALKDAGKFDNLIRDYQVINNFPFRAQVNFKTFFYEVK